MSEDKNKPKETPCNLTIPQIPREQIRTESAKPENTKTPIEKEKSNNPDDWFSPPLLFLSRIQQFA